MELDQLRYFLRVAERGNFTRAAEELGLSQPALSRSIQRLEEELERPLLERRSRSVAVTEAGELFKARAQQVLSLLEDTKAEITDDGQSGQLRVAAIPTIAPYFLPDLLRQFSTEFPRASLVVQEDTTDHLVKRCKEGEIDLAVLALPVSAKYLEIEPLFEEELLLVLPPVHALIDKEEIDPGDVEQYPFVLLDEAHCLSENVLSFCRQRGRQPLAVERANQLAMVQELVSLAHGVSMIPEMARRVDASGPGRRVYRSLHGETPKRTIVAVWNPYRFQSRLLGAFKERLRTYAQSFASAADAGA